MNKDEKAWELQKINIQQQHEKEMRLMQFKHDKEMNGINHQHEKELRK